ncbi:MAG: iron-containing alcohol dehydrogenase [Desulfosarcina sp.]|nr:iron-containing alcohol dehydrogenase [Desulfobacterales bacterium]
MDQLRKFVSPEIVFGAGAIELAGRYARNLGASKILLVTDPGVLAAGWPEKVLQSLAAGGVAHAVFADISPNPRAEEVMLGAERYETENCDVIVAVGGGSPMDCAKGIGMVSTNGRHVLEFEGVDRVDLPGPPLICIPTTAGTASDLSQFAIISNLYEKTKVVIISKTAVPDVALVDPVTTTTMDAYLTACTGMDALVHAIEALVSNTSSPLTDLHALEAIRLIHRFLPEVLNRPDDIELRTRLMLGSLEAGLAFSNASLGAVHAMSHSLSGWLDLAHGECNSILIDHVVRFNWSAAEERYHRIGQAMGLALADQPPEEACEAVVAAITRIKQKVGIRRTLKDCGVDPTDFSALARNAISDPCMATNPVWPTRQDVEMIYEEAL